VFVRSTAGHCPPIGQAGRPKPETTAGCWLANQPRTGALPPIGQAGRPKPETTAIGRAGPEAHRVESGVPGPRGDGLTPIAHEVRIVRDLEREDLGPVGVHEGEEKALIKLEGTVEECRADAASTLAAAREARDIVIERVGRRTGSRPATNPAGG
jgi:hypothetical protein